MKPPMHVLVRECERPFWDAIIKSRARDEWAETDLVVAAQLARCQSDIENESRLLAGEGSVIEDDRGRARMNPRHSVLQQLAQRETALMRCLSIAGVASRPDKRTLANQRKQERSAAEAKREVEREALLAKPTITI